MLKLFSVRYIRGRSVVWQGVLGAPAVVIGVGGSIVLQLAFIYPPIMLRLFQPAENRGHRWPRDRRRGSSDASILETEKRVLRVWLRRLERARRTNNLNQHGGA